MVGGMAVTNPSERGARVRFPPPVVFAACLLCGIALGRVAPAPALPLDRTLRIAVGALVLASGVGLVLSARLLFLRTKQSPVPWTPTPELIVAGPYRLTRNPMYAGISLVQVGVGIVSANPWLFLAAAVALGIVHRIAVVPEEEYLAARFGAPYEEYRRRVRRYL
jgi:protein-S-isoprenylcysteine O-methyltransferase Ste14